MGSLNQYSFALQVSERRPSQNNPNNAWNMNFNNGNVNNNNKNNNNQVRAVRAF